MIFTHHAALATPYAGITQIRFKGYLLSPMRHPLLYWFSIYSTPPPKSRPIPPPDERRIAAGSNRAHRPWSEPEASRPQAGFAGSAPGQSPTASSPIPKSRRALAAVSPSSSPAVIPRISARRRAVSTT